MSSVGLCVNASGLKQGMWKHFVRFFSVLSDMSSVLLSSLVLFAVSFIVMYKEAAKTVHFLLCHNGTI